MEVETRCNFWLPKKNRFCANARLYDSSFCGNHKPRSHDQWIACPIDPSHSVLRENLEGHVKRCPFVKQVKSLTVQPFYQKGINSGNQEDEDEDEETISSELKRNAVYSMSVTLFSQLITKIDSLHQSIRCDIRDSYKIPEACDVWIKRQVDGKLPFQEKHVTQQASILGNLEEFGILDENSIESEGFDHGGSFQDGNAVPAVVEFGAGRGYLTQMLADCYGIQKVFLVERKSYKLKADRSLRQKEKLTLERLRIDIEDLNLNAVESLRGLPYLAIGKHLCGPATDLTLRCCLMAQRCNQENVPVSSVNINLRGLAIATCCHHLCQWKNYINKNYFSNLGIMKEEFHAITWFTSWAVDADHSSSDLSDVTNGSMDLQSIDREMNFSEDRGVEEVIRNIKAVERAALGFKCKQIIDMGRMAWLKEHGLDTQFFKYVPSSISPENHLIIARCINHL